MKNKSRSVCIIIQNNEGKILLMLRDDKPEIRFPNKWITLGGVVENGETPNDAIKREIMEEIEIDLKDFVLFKEYKWPEKTEYVYYAILDLEPAKIKLHEGQDIKYFTLGEVKNVDLAFHDNQIIEDFRNTT